MAKNGGWVAIVCTIILIGIVVVALTLALTMPTIDKLHDWKVPLPAPPKMEPTTENHRNEVLLAAMANWIYSHSYRTDRHMSRWIATCILENTQYDIPTFGWPCRPILNAKDPYSWRRFSQCPQKTNS